MNGKEGKDLIEKNRLKNNLDLVIYFRYRATAGDRCQVTFEAEIDVEIKEDYFKDQVLSILDIETVRSLLGEKTSYIYSKTRNFIAEGEKQKIFNELKQQFLDSSLPYISSDSFPAKLIKRNYVLAEKDEMIRLQREAYFKEE